MWFQPSMPMTPMTNIGTPPSINHVNGATINNINGQIAFPMLQQQMNASMFQYPQIVAPANMHVAQGVNGQLYPEFNDVRASSVVTTTSTDFGASSQSSEESRSLRSTPK